MRKLPGCRINFRSQVNEFKSLKIQRRQGRMSWKSSRVRVEMLEKLARNRLKTLSRLSQNTSKIDIKDKSTLIEKVNMS